MGDRFREWFAGLSTVRQVAVSIALAPFVIVLMAFAAGCALLVFELAKAFAIAVWIIRP